MLHIPNQLLENVDAALPEVPSFKGEFRAEGVAARSANIGNRVRIRGRRQKPRPRHERNRGGGASALLQDDPPTPSPWGKYSVLSEGWTQEPVHIALPSMSSHRKCFSKTARPPYASSSAGRAPQPVHPFPLPWPLTSEVMSPGLSQRCFCPGAPLELLHRRRIDSYAWSWRRLAGTAPVGCLGVSYRQKWPCVIRPDGES